MSHVSCAFLVPKTAPTCLGFLIQDPPKTRSAACTLESKALQSTSAVWSLEQIRQM